MGLGKGHCPWEENRGCCYPQRVLGQEAGVAGRAPQGLLEGGMAEELKVVQGAGSQGLH